LALVALGSKGPIRRGTYTRNFMSALGVKAVFTLKALLEELVSLRLACTRVSLKKGPVKR
jgi:hypothetical protein